VAAFTLALPLSKIVQVSGPEIVIGFPEYDGRGTTP